MSRFSGNLTAVSWRSTVRTLDVARLWITHLSLCLCNSRAQRKHDGTVAEGAAKLIWSKLSITRYYTMTRDYSVFKLSFEYKMNSYGKRKPGVNDQTYFSFLSLASLLNAHAHEEKYGWLARLGCSLAQERKRR